LRAKCSACKSPISIQYPIVEFLGMVVAIVPALIFGASWATLAFAAVGWALLAASAIDAKTKLLPDDITLPLAWAGIVFAASGLHPYLSLSQSVWGAVAGYLSLWSVYWAFKLLTKKEGMGYGDFKLLAALGAWAGPGALVGIVLLSSVLGVVWAAISMVRKTQTTGEPMPFGPYLALAGWISMYAQLSPAFPAFMRMGMAAA
jgi:leader peptidase (prepilin peptidase)/N-methyltransferase